MNQRQWGPGPNYGYPFQVVPPQFPNQFPFHTSQYQQGNKMMTPYDYFQKPPIPMNNQQNSGNQGFSGGFVNKGGNPLLKQFQGQGGQMDFDKIFNTVGQIVNTVNQVQPLVKQVGSFMKGFKI